MKKKLRNQLFGALMLGLLSSNFALAQFTVSGQVRTRSELRGGQGTLATKEVAPAFFTSQRTRLNVGYAGYRFKLFTAIQDVRVWGQDASTINRITPDANDGLMVHEAWGEIMLLDTTVAIDYFSLKIGRQELVYDDSRLLGNLDWLQQGRRHDLALLKLENKGWLGHFGVAYNQNQERKASTIYNGIPTGYTAGTNGIGTLYKSMQFLYLGRKFGKGNASFLVLKDDFNKYHMDSTARVLDKGTWSRVTSGFYVATNLSPKISFTGSAYLQGGKDKNGGKLRSHLVSAAAMYAVSPQLSVGP
ncbi:MAG: alginate export family protein, partial [Adhaeribacter sp.]